jgi:hypothetical protein
MNEMAIILQSELKSRNNGVTTVVKSWREEGVRAVTSRLYEAGPTYIWQLF